MAAKQLRVVLQPPAAAAANQRTPRMDVKFPILGFLMDSELSGYDLKSRFQSDDPVGFHYRASDGSLYPALKKLAREGLVTMHTERRGRRARKVYAITRRGRDRFLAMLREPAQPVFVFDEAQVKVYFSHHDPRAGMAHLERMCDEDSQNATYVSELADRVSREDADRFRRVVVQLVRALVTAKAKAVVTLCAQLKQELNGQHRGRRNGRASAVR